MKISVIGLGYVGTVAVRMPGTEGSRCGRRGHRAAQGGADRAGQVAHRRAGDRRDPAASRSPRAACIATTDVTAAVRQADIVLICVGTPAQPSGGLELAYLRRVCEQIGAALRDHPGAPIIAVRSTVLPGTTRQHGVPILEQASGLHAGSGLRRVRQSGVPARGHRGEPTSTIRPRR